MTKRASRALNAFAALQHRDVRNKPTNVFVVRIVRVERTMWQASNNGSIEHTLITRKVAVLPACRHVDRRVVRNAVSMVCLRLVRYSELAR
eukprot:m.121091 g.121091  ORF g.121091 m.121091 type:complete len:91 (+) comp21877_c0_seq3:897-1169(+)